MGCVEGFKKAIWQLEGYLQDQVRTSTRMRPTWDQCETNMVQHGTNYGGEQAILKMGVIIYWDIYGAIYRVYMAQYMVVYDDI